MNLCFSDSYNSSIHGIIFSLQRPVLRNAIQVEEYSTIKIFKA